jgi:hypothetical protein
MSTQYSWNDETKWLAIHSRETQEPIYEARLPSFGEAKRCADAFEKLYQEGVRHGKLTVTEEVQRTLDHVDRNI